MPTIPREAHQARSWAESFGADPERYDRARPRYPNELIRGIAAAGGDVVDVGCGTGIAARQLQDAGCNVLGVEVDPRMAAYARTTGLDVEVAAFEEWDPAGRTFDAVVSGQTWHWVDPAAGAAKAAQALRPGGRLAVFWNVGLPSDVSEAFAAVYGRVAPDLPLLRATMPGVDGYAPVLAKAADGMREAGFDEPEQWRVDWEQPYTREEWLDQIRTHGYAGQFTPEQMDALVEGIGAAVGDGFTMRYAAVALTALRTPRSRR
jgi:SAM-dependent methyltransferase